MEYGILMAADSEVDFMIHGLFSYELFGQTLWITTSHVCILIVMLLLLTFALIANRKIKHATEVPDTFQCVIELIVEKLDGMVENAMGHNAKYFANYIGTIFCFIFRCPSVLSEYMCRWPDRSACRARCRCRCW